MRAIKDAAATGPSSRAVLLKKSEPEKSNASSDSDVERYVIISHQVLP
jgi:hypothetical protein